MTDTVKTLDHDLAVDHDLDAGHDLDADLAALGEGEVAYVRPMLSDDITRIFPQAPDLAPGLALFALLSASGAPILLTDSHDAAVANAWAHDLQPVSVH